MNVSSPKKSARRSIFSRRRRHVRPLEAAPELEESSESSLEPSLLNEKDMKDHIGELSASFNVNQESNSSIDSTTESRISFTTTNEDGIKELILSYKSKPRPLIDTPTPAKPYRCNSFKMDGVPAFMSREIEKKARRDAEKRRRRQQAKSKAENDKLHESMASLSMPQVTRKQRPKVPFLDLPKEHPLYWNYSELSASDFPEADRAFLAKLFKNPQRMVRGKRLSNRVELTLRKMQLFDWDVAIVGRCANELFNAETNPLDLTPATNQYFFTRFNALKEKLQDGSEVTYMKETYKGSEALEELGERLKKDMEEATLCYDANPTSTSF